MHEFELKLEVPPNRTAAVLQELAQGEKLPLRAVYFDTGDRALRKHRVGLRLRREGDHWVQTAKADTRDAMRRLEHNVELAGPTGDDVPPVDVTRHAGTPLGKQIDRALKGEGGADDAALLPWLEVSVLRLAETVQAGQSRVEIAFDQGHMTSGAHTRPICELEFELKEGRAEDAIQLARDWCARHGLWLQMASKAERGTRLESGELFGAPVQAAPPAYRGRHAPDRVAREVLSSCLSHILGNASEVASGSSGAEHIHQLRVAIRRMRTVMRDMLPRDIRARWEPVLADVFRALGKHRDLRHVALALEPHIEQAGGPVVRPEAEGVPDPVALVRSRDFQDALLGLLALAARDVPSGAKTRRAFRKRVGRKLRKLHARTKKDARQFLELDEPHRHRVRKRLKRVRYLAEIAGPLFGRARVERFIAQLKPAQEALGQYNDVVMAFDIYRRLAKKDARAWFGAGWLAAQRESDERVAAKAVRRLPRSAPV